MKLRASNIVHDAIERAIDGAIPYAIRRWYKYREPCAASTLLESKDFQDHLRQHAFDEVTRALGDIIDFEDDVPELPFRGEPDTEPRDAA